MGPGTVLEHLKIIPPFDSSIFQFSMQATIFIICISIVTITAVKIFRSKMRRNHDKIFFIQKFENKVFELSSWRMVSVKIIGRTIILLKGSGFYRDVSKAYAITQPASKRVK